jgi:hypothetical protein
MGIPHIADDDGCLRCLPTHGPFRNSHLAAAKWLFAALAGPQVECSRDFGAIWHRGFATRFGRLRANRRHGSWQYPEERPSPHKPPCFLQRYHFKRRAEVGRSDRRNELFLFFLHSVAGGRGPGDVDCLFTLINVLNDSVRIDNERRTVCDTRGRNQHPVIGGDFSGEIAEKRILGVELARPMIQRGLIIGADCQDLRFRSIEILDTSLVSGDFLGSATCERGREKGQHNSLLAAKVRQFDFLAEAAVHFEVGSLVTDLEVSLTWLHGTLCQKT